MGGGRGWPGSALQDLSRPDDALQHFQKAITLRPGFGGAYSNKGYVLRTLGKLDEANAAFETAIALEPRRPDLYRLLGESRTFQSGDPYLAALEAFAAESDTFPDEQRAELHFALAKAYRDLGNHDQSFCHLLQGNALVRKTVSYDETQALHLLTRTREIFNREVFAARKVSWRPISGTGVHFWHAALGFNSS